MKHVLSYGCKLCTTPKKQKSKIHASEIKFLRGVKRYSQLDHIQKLR